MTRLIAALCLFSSVGLHAHLGDHPSVHDSAAGAIERLRKSPAAFQAKNWTAVEALRFLTSAEREIFSQEHIRFTVSAPVKVLVIRGKDPAEDLFWLSSRGFKKADLLWTENKVKLTAWEKDFPAGPIGLGVNSLSGGGSHYSIVLRPLGQGNIAVTDVYPGQLRVSALTNGAAAYADAETKFSAVPASMVGLTYIQTLAGARNVAKFVDIFRLTEHPSSDRPDQVVLTWSDDPRTSQTIQWRTSTKVKTGTVLYQRKRDAGVLRGRSAPKRAKAATEKISTLMVLNDPVVHRHSAVLRGLEPDTAYVYSVGGSGSDWSEEAEFTTAPAGVKPFSFVYMGDAQNGLDRWGTLLKNAFRQKPDAAFYIMAGDLVNRGADRDDWDSLFHNSVGIYDRRPLVPVIGNHECQGGHPTLYLKNFTLPTNGPTAVEKERAYAFEYSNALFVILDSNLAAHTQTNWLDQVLGGTKATWKFVTYHHPAFSSGVNRNNKGVRDLWTPIFDKHHVDLALQGHDHAYLRTYPMKGQQKVATAADGTVYVVSVSGVKFYDQGSFPYTQVGFTNVATFQVLDIQVSGDRMVYRAYDTDQKIRDEFVIEKKAAR